MNWKRILAALAVPFVFFGIGLAEILSNMAKVPVDAAHKLPAWPAETVKTFGSLPVQEDGRIKPLETMAAFRLLRFHGTRTMRLKYTDGTKRTLKPTEWLLDCLFHPEKAKAYPTFVVDDPGAVTAIGAKGHESRRQRYSYNELLPAKEKLLEMGRKYSEIKTEKRDPIQGMIVKLAEDMVEFERITGSLRWAREGMPMAESDKAALASVLKDGKLPYSTYLRATKEMGRTTQFNDVPESVLESAMSSMLLTVYPHPEKEQTQWMSLGHMITAGLIKPEMQAKAFEVVDGWENLVSLANKRNEFNPALAKVADDIHRDATARGEDWRLPVETFYNWANFFYRALLLFVLAFLLQAITWLQSPGSGVAKWLHIGTWCCMIGGLLLVITGMMLRCVIMDRWLSSVVTNLYETILFITAFVTLVGLAAELLTRRRIALPLTAFLATVGMFLAMKFEGLKSEDTLAPLEAVLNTNYWLSIHVTSINIGYAGGLLAAGFSGVYLVARLFDPARKDKEFFTTLTRCAYGIVCFGLFFSLVGTILGGLWANDSWGRFWGWDPKENGALMIVLSFLIILHARLGGYIKEFGLHMLTLLTGNVVVFSWWHVNLLGVGLHSYGFTSGIKQVVLTVYWVIALVALLGVIAWVLARRVNRQLPPAPHSPTLAGDVV